jgi:hypothetical protein
VSFLHQNARRQRRQEGTRKRKDDDTGTDSHRKKRQMKEIQKTTDNVERMKDDNCLRERYNAYLREEEMLGDLNEDDRIIHETRNML